MALLTLAVGATVSGRIADRLGRKKICGYEVLVLAVGAIAAAFAPRIWWLIGCAGCSAPAVQRLTGGPAQNSRSAPSSVPRIDS